MLELDETALICDLAETYGILDYQRVPVKTLGALCSGLRSDSRIMQKINGVKADYKSILLTRIFDDLELMLWTRTKKPTEANRPKPVSEALFEKEEKHERFASGAEFMKARAKFIKD